MVAAKKTMEYQVFRMKGEPGAYPGVCAMKRLLICLLVMILTAGMLFPAVSSALTNNEIKSTPYSAVAAIKSTFKCGCTRWGAGVQVACNALITASTSLCCHQHNKSAKTLEFWWGMVNTSNYKSHYSGKTTYTWYADFSNGYKSEHDIGYVIFPSDVGNKSGWLASSFWDNVNDFKSREEIKMIGYNTEWEMDYYWSNVEKVGSLQIRFPQGTRSWISGLPVCVYRDGKTEPTVRAIYTSNGSGYFYARSLTNKIYYDMIDSGAKFN